MFGFFLYFIALIKCNRPKWAMIFAGPDATQENLDSEYGTQEQLKDIEKYCKENNEDEDEYKYCMEYLTTYKGGFLSSGANINNVLQKIPSDTEIVNLVGCNFAEIDFGNLKSQMIVMFEYDEGFCESIFTNQIKDKTRKLINRMIKSSFNGSVESFMKYTQIKNKEVKRKKSKNPKLLDETVSIVGNAKDKVSLLYVSEGLLKFTKNDLNIHTMFLDYCQIDVQSKKIKTNCVIFKDSGYDFNYENFDSDLFKVDQAGIYITPSFYINYDVNYEFKIYYEDSYWSLEFTDNRDEDKIYRIPYKMASKFNLIAKSNYFSIIRNSNLDTYKPINITLVSENPYQYLDSGSLVKLTIHTENWEDVPVEKLPSIECIYDKNFYELEIDESSPFTISTPQPYEYVPKNDDDDPNNKPDDGKSNKAGMIAGITVACVVVIVVIVVVVIFVIRKKKANAQTASDGEEV